MNLPRYDRFSQPHYLQHIGRERVTKLLNPFATELLKHGIMLNAPSLPDEAFFVVLATLPRQADKLSERLVDMMTAIEVLDEKFPDERRPLEVSEIRLRVRVKGRPVLLTPSANHGVLDGGMNGLVEGGKDGIVDCWIEGLAGNAKDEWDAAREDGGSATGNRPTTAEVAQAAFALIVKLDATGKQKAPTPLTVFRHYCIEGLSAEQVATKCRCSKGTVMGRLRLIEAQTKTKPEQFRVMSSHLQELADNYDRSGAREVYRRGLVEGEVE